MRGAPKTRGVTIIELLLIVIIVCILGTLIYLTFNSIQAKNRNAERRKDIDTLKSQLEAYYANSNVYPTLANMNDAAWRQQNIKHLPADAVKDPAWNKDNASCTSDNQKPQFAAKPAVECYSYQASAADGAPCDNTAAQCAHYTITAILEGGENYTKASLN